MLVRNWMCRPPVTVKADAPLQTAAELLTIHNIHEYIRAYGLDLPNRRRVKEAIRAQAELLYAVDHEENAREIYPKASMGKPTAPEGTQ